MSSWSNTWVDREDPLGKAMLASYVGVTIPWGVRNNDSGNVSNRVHKKEDIFMMNSNSHYRHNGLLRVSWGISLVSSTRILNDRTRAKHVHPSKIDTTAIWIHEDQCYVVVSNTKFGGYVGTLLGGHMVCSVEHRHWRSRASPTLEVMACMEAMTLAVDLHLQHVIVVLDYLQVVDNLQYEYGWSYSMITDEIKAWMCLGSC
jgi:hypothetical protein